MVLPRLAVLHVALNPVTGVWSVMRELAKAQARSSLYASVGIGILADASWPALYREELQSLGLPSFLGQTPKAFGTAQFLWQRIKPPPIDHWVDELLAGSGASMCVVHFHNAWLSGVFLPMTSVRQGRARTVATFHGVNAHFRRQPIRQRLHRWMGARLPRFRATLTSVDEANLQRAASLLGLAPALFTVVPNGIPDTTVRGCQFLAPRGSNRFTVGHVGSIVPQKGWQIVFDAVRNLRAKGHDLHLILAGRGSDSELASRLAREHATWLRYEGFVANPREALLPQIDALALMSEQEGLPMAIIEAFSVGLPVIATPVGGVPEAVKDGRNGFLIARTAAALSAALLRLVGNRGTLMAFSKEARRTFEERYEISRIVARYHKVYGTTS